MEDQKLTERDIQREIMYQFAQGDTFLPNFMPPGWWENDVIRVTASGYWYEYEIKLSRADFIKDRYKKMGLNYYRNPMGITKDENKHAILARNDSMGPKQFWFVCPEGIIQPEEIPSWAGLMWALTENGYRGLKVKKKAPNRKTKKQELSFINKINYNGTKRYTNKIMYGRE